MISSMRRADGGRRESQSVLPPILRFPARNAWAQTARLLAIVIGCATPLQSQQLAREARALAQESDKALSSQNYDLAISGYRKALKIDPSFAAAWNNLGSAWFAKKQYAKASEAFRQATRLKPRNADYQFNIALVSVRSDRCEAAKPYLERSMISDSLRARSQFLKGVCAFIHGEWQAAEGELTNAEASGIKTAEAYYMLTIASRKIHNPEGAEKAYGLLCRDYPDSPLIHELLGEALDRADQNAAARNEITLAIASRPSEPGLHAQLGLLLWKAYNFSDAQASFAQELAIDKHSYPAMHYLGDIAEQSNHFDTALNWYKLALQENLESGEAHYAIGRVLAKTGNYREALIQLQTSFPAMEQDVSAQYWTARVLQKLGDTEEARKHLARVREINEVTRLSLLHKLEPGIE